MARLGFSGLAAMLLCGCAWVLPKPSPGPVSEATSRMQAACSIERSEGRGSALARLSAAGSPAPVIILLADGPAADRTIRNGTRVLLRRLTAAGDDRVAAETDTAAFTIAAAGGAGSDPVEILGDTMVRLRRSSPAGNAAADPSSADEYVIYKADVADPNRASTCDPILRDGDLVYLRTVTHSAWVEVRDGTLAAAPAGTPATGACAASGQRCYTDRYGGLVCAKVPGCLASARQ